ncbi:Uncharacterized protein ALO38_01101 [Pseudomonas coronafaciens pv. zizaniae]|nr:Uncharacterized protein ALO38_01101 [Pseudomonas coronafaciens pv. zizaniae]
MCDCVPACVGIGEPARTGKCLAQYFGKALRAWFGLRNASVSSINILGKPHRPSRFTKIGGLLLKVRIYSDLHLEIEAPAGFPPISAGGDADLVILAGDIHTKGRGVTWAQEKFGVPVAYVCGNHEFYKGHIDRTLQSMKQLAAGSNVHVLENESLVIGELRILGATAWTDFSTGESVYQASQEASRGMNDFRLIRAGEGYRALSISDVISRNHRTYEWLNEELAKEFDGQTVVITHHCPLVNYCGPEQGSLLMPAYSNDWPELIHQADVWVFGHTHSHVDVIVDGCRLISNPRGYPGEQCGFIDDFMIDIN